MKRFASFLLIFVMIFSFSVTTLADDKEVTVSVDGKTLDFGENKPLLNEDGRTLISTAVIEKDLGCKVIIDNSSKSVTVQNSEKKVTLKAGENKATVTELKGNTSSVKTLDTKISIKDGIYYVPLRFTLDTLGMRVYWDDYNFSVYIATKGNEGPSVFIIGDSTACNYEAKRAPRAGWGQVINQLFNDKVLVRNMAISGRSSKSYIDEEHLKNLLEDIKPNDYVFIQFGHNDEKKEDAKRYTEPATTFKTYLSMYIDEVEKRGAKPILVTPVNRNSFDENGKLKLTHGDYPAAMIQLAAERKIPYIDVTGKSEELFNSLGVEGTYKLFLNLEPGENPNYPDGVHDTTHFKDTGALEIARLVIDGIKENKLSLADYLK